ncbi:sulfotransferase family protein [Rhodopirellula baltica]|uniref:Protein-tyrosine sulfotransferase n=1 Tax=Rhodopirellula baltica WH47 TaxID=991778 RepID=F2AWN1_RHOBT|nr:protein-tyrosine sulfotransferase [Rhodopirellula baltica WH47]
MSYPDEKDSAEPHDVQKAFVVGCARSGTTLLATLLGQHTAVASTPETHFVCRVRQMKAWNDFRLACDLADEGSKNLEKAVDVLFDSTYLADLQISRKALIERFQSLRSHTKKPSECIDQIFFTAILNQFAAERRKTVCVEKTPAHLFHVDELLGWFPESQVICIYRDGRDSVNSLMKLEHALRSPLKYTTDWNRCASTMLRLRLEHPKRFMTVRYEDLLTHPDATMSNVHGRLNLSPMLPQSDALIETRVETVPEWEKNWKMKATQPLDATRCFAWKRELSDQEASWLTALMADSLQRLDYPSCAPPPSRRQIALATMTNAYSRVLFSRKLQRIRSKTRYVLEHCRLWPGTHRYRGQHKAKRSALD